MRRIRALLCFTALVACSPGFASLERGIEAWQAGKYELAVAALSDAAAAGDRRAAGILGELHEEGRGVVSNPAKAAEYYRQAGEAVPRSQFRLGMLTLRGIGTTRNVAEGLRLMTFAADSGVVESALVLSRVYADGVFVPPDEAASERWLKHALDANHPAAQYQMWMNVRTKEPEQAMQWLRKSAAADYPPATFMLAWSYLRGEGVAKDVDEGLRWLRVAANKGHAMAQGILGKTLEQGRWLKQDLAESIRWLRKGAEGQDPESQAWLAAAYRDGKGVPKDKVEAFAWFDVAALNSDNPDRQKWNQEKMAVFGGMTAQERQRGQALAADYAKRFRRPMSFR